MYRDITIEEVFELGEIILVDVRSEKEYSEDTIPGAINIPLLNNEERASVGTVYRKEGPEPAKRLGLDLVSPKLDGKVAVIDELAHDKKVVIFCWRGGLRSEFIASYLDSKGYPVVYRITGGYKAYRRYVNEYLKQHGLPLKAVVLHGLTGVGKTDLLVRLKQKGIPVLDLEGLARHRGSVYGKVGLPPSPAQKAFESGIVQLLRSACRKGLFVVECESRRLGNLLVPPMVMDFIRGGYRVLVYASLENRAKRIREVYTGGSDFYIEELQKATSSLANKLGRARVEEFNRLIADNDYGHVISYMLKYYYDPLYNYPDSTSEGYDLCVDTADFEKAVDKIHMFIAGLP
ncbi:MAG: tRNA 2-selenouridine synthase [Pelotomaculum sp. PtaU1.Bin035]|nr:MAG: tRNA 2-selenouridine synthase [Pelotomaculum sp. PtaU1.Bin035]